MIMIPTLIAGDVVERAGLTVKIWPIAIHFGTTAAKSIDAIAAMDLEMRMTAPIGEESDLAIPSFKASFRWYTSS